MEVKIDAKTGKLICPKCNNETAQRQISGGTGFVLQGGGWASSGYATK